MTGLKKCTWWTILSFTLGALFGTGSYWQWKSLQVSVKQQEIDGVIKKAEIRKKVSDLQQEIIELTDKYVFLIKQEKLEGPTKESFDKIRRLGEHLDVVKDDFKSLETNLSQLEGREPRSINIEFQPK